MSSQAKATNTQIRVTDSMLCPTKRGTKKAQMEQGFLTEEETLLGCSGFSSTNCQSTSHYPKKRIQAFCDDNMPPNTHTVLTQVVFWSGTCSTSLAQAMLPTPTGLPNK